MKAGAIKIIALIEALKINNVKSLSLELSCKQLPDTVSYNVIGEIKGSKFPEEIILVGSGKGVVSLKNIPQISWRSNSDNVYKRLKNIYETNLKWKYDTE